MNTREAESLVYKYMAKHDLPDEWLFRWQNKKGALGTCSYNKKEIRLSKWYVELNDLMSVRDTILHEVAHALSYVRYGSKGIGHGGGVRLSSSSSDFQNFEAFVNAVLAE